jgi:two-component system, OmpR family, response regulator
MPRVILIEDDALVRKLLEKRLLAAGHEVICLPDGRKLQETLDTHPADMLLIDMGLPYGNGLTLVEKIRAQGITTPIMILTAYELPKLYEMVRNLGADDLMMKPYDQEALLIRMNKIMAAA